MDNKQADFAVKNVGMLWGRWTLYQKMRWYLYHKWGVGKKSVENIKKELDTLRWFVCGLDDKKGFAKSLAEQAINECEKNLLPPWIEEHPKQTLMADMFIKPIQPLEYIQMDFVVTKDGVVEPQKKE